MNNGTAIGYMILAAKRLGLKKETIQKLESAMSSEMDFATEEYAEKTYQQFQRGSGTMESKKVILRPATIPKSKWVILIPEKGSPNICEMLEFERYIDAARYFIDNNMVQKGEDNNQLYRT